MVERGGERCKRSGLFAWGFVQCDAKVEKGDDVCLAGFIVREVRKDELDVGCGFLDPGGG